MLTETVGREISISESLEHMGCFRSMMKASVTSMFQLLHNCSSNLNITASKTTLSPNDSKLTKNHYLEAYDSFLKIIRRIK